MTIKSELLEIKGDQELLVVEQAHQWAKTHEDSELHRALEWNDKKAGYEYRLSQIRRLIVVHVGYDTRGPSFISLSVDRARPGGGYRDILDVVAVQSLYEVMLADAMVELERIREKYKMLSELTPVWATVGKVKNKNKKGKNKKKPSKGDEGPEARP